MQKRAQQVAAMIFAWCLCTTVWADEYSAQWGLAVGTKLPVLEALDQDGATRTFGDLAGEHGLLMFINRSADW